MPQDMPQDAPHTIPATGSPLRVSVVSATNRHFISRLDELIDIHLAAMDYPKETHAQRKSLWIYNGSQPDFTCSMALLHRAEEQPDPSSPRQRCVGIGFTFRGSPNTWWYRQVARGLVLNGNSRTEATRILHAYAELSEIHVLPAAQGEGVGTSILNDLLERTPQNTVMLSTPEVEGEANAAWQLYRKAGFTDVLRNFKFPADPRPFGILQRTRS
ncbi:N-acetyltransferase [Corynebacterium jeikeium]|uniref:GNAT family N-acetyltransferase n=1 Tax=Corynebacterium jeikeium TaxID=38289 RepID=UPI0001B71916|nr:GNAT family N-acetyltransferase [Corynebacterium jeikeium]EEW16995.1 acetyltransferase, GNAT family [Corynebacterium jeikeium ATCC 43734]OOD30079.1 N-acetyltransferase [Corynebacterium jeikeium]WCZ53305.1 Acetyltransferase (GNAT) family protein [Corynebacterium jeikeium]SUY81384.1 putative GCN5-related N-acetyltransferase [Corynebacterium jeikeium]